MLPGGKQLSGTFLKNQGELEGYRAAGDGVDAAALGGGVVADLAKGDGQEAAAGLGHANAQTVLRYADQHDTTTDAQIRAWRRRKTAGRSAG